MRNRICSLVVCLAFFLTSCARTPLQQSRLDSSGVTVVTLDDSIVLAQPLPSVASGARDYVFIGPVEINTMGKREYYLWVSLASTIDREFVGLTTTAATRMVLLVDNEPMQFAINRWHTELDTPPYLSPAPVYATLEAHTTLDQIHRIAAADTVELHLVAAADGTSGYQFWNGDWGSWRRFPEGL